MSAMTAGELKRRARATRGRPIVAAVPGQQAVTAGEQRPGPATARRRHGPAGQAARILTVVPSPQAAAQPEAAPRIAAQPEAARRTAAQPEAARARAAQPQRARAQTTRSQPVEPRMAAPRTGGPQPARRQRGLPEMARNGAAQPGMARPRAGRLGRPQPARPGVARPETALARPVRTRVRLTRRGRIVVAALIAAGVMLVAALAWLAGTARADAARSGSSASAVYHSLRSVVVRPGESLWAVATRADPAADPRSVIQEIIDLNALNGTSVQPGQRLWLPRGECCARG